MRRSQPLHPFRLVVGAAVAASLVGACTAAAGPSSTPPAGAGSAATSLPSVAVQPKPSANAGGPEAWILVGRSGKTGLQLLDARTGETLMDLPAGSPDSGWTRVVTATTDGSKTQVRDILLDGGLPGPRLDIDGRWRLPTIGTDSVPAGVAADGSTIVLVPAEDATASAAPASRFAIVQHVLGDHPTTSRDAQLRLTTVVELPAGFEFDAVSPDGRILYVVEHLAGQTGAYQVRAVDLPGGRLRDAVIADKRNIGEAMAGWPIAQVRRPDGLVFTLYRGAAHPFVHALNTAEAWAVCIDLPGGGAPDTPEARDWGLAPTSDGRSVYAINVSQGVVVEMDPTQLTIRRTGTLHVASAGGTGSAGSGGSSGSIVLAKFGHQAVGPAGRVVVAPDGKTIWAGGGTGIVAIETDLLSINRRMLSGTAVDGITVAPDGHTLYALLHTAGRIVALDPATGESLGDVPGDGFDQLLAAAPW